MTQAANAILDALLRLPEGDRAELAAGLLDSLESGTDWAAEAGWSEELRARIDEFRSGQAKAVPWAEARARILDAHSLS